MEERQLSRRERQIMDAIYARGSASATEVWRALTDPPSRTAVRTLMRILEEKGHLKHAKKGREFIYRPVRARTRAGLSALRRVLQTFFNGSIEKAMATHLADPGATLDAGELKRLVKLINDARESED